MLKRMAAICSAVVMAVMSLGGTAFAEEPKDTGCLVVEYYDNGKPIVNAGFQIWQVGTMEYGEIHYKEPYSEYHVSTTMVDTLPALLADYISRDQVAPDASRVTDEKGACRFDGLDDGMYLISGPEQKQLISGMNPAESDAAPHEKTYYPQPLLVEVAAGKTLIVEPKMLTLQATERDTLSVVKVWEQDDKSEGSHPEKISVDLLENGSVKETIELSDQNEWAHTWNIPVNGATWSVVESSVPEGYELSSEIVDGTIILTNKKVQPKDTVKGEIDSPTKLPDNTDGTKQNPTKGGSGKLPQTGMLRYPILLLIAGSIITAVTGVIYLKKAGRKDD